MSCCIVCEWRLAWNEPASAPWEPALLNVGTDDVAHVSRRAVAPFLATCLARMARGAGCPNPSLTASGKATTYLSSAPSLPSEVCAWIRWVSSAI